MSQIKSPDKNSEPNAQNSEIDPIAHPSGARIENMMKRAQAEKAANRAASSAFGDQLRDSEKPDASLIDDVAAASVVDADGASEEPIDKPKKDGHRSSPNHREI